MLPQSVFWTWIVGAINWILLATAVFFLWEWADGIVSAPREPTPDVDAVQFPDDSAVAGRVEDQTVTIRREGRQYDRLGGRTFLIAGLGLAALSLCGGWPLIIAGRFGAGGPAHPQPDREQIIKRPDGAQLHVEFHGETNRPTGPTFVFTHGWTLDRSAWSYVVRELANRFCLVVWELRGHTRSTSPSNGDFAIETMARDLESVVQIAGQGPIILIGHSIGGMVTQTFSRLFPQHLGSRVAALALVHTTYTNPLRTGLFATFWTAIEKPILVPLNYLSIALAPLVWLSNLQSYLNGSLHLMTRIASFSGRQTWGQLDYAAWLAAIAWPAVTARGNLAMLPFDEQQQLQRLTIPVLVIGGRHDRMTKLEASERIATLAPNSREMQINSGHLGIWERPQDIAALLVEFAFQTGSPSAAEKASSPRDSARGKPMSPS